MAAVCDECVSWVGSAVLGAVARVCRMLLRVVGRCVCQFHVLHDCFQSASKLRRPIQANAGARLPHTVCSRRAYFVFQLRRPLAPQESGPMDILSPLFAGQRDGARGNLGSFQLAFPLSGGNCGFWICLSAPAGVGVWGPADSMFLRTTPQTDTGPESAGCSAPMLMQCPLLVASAGDA